MAIYRDHEHRPEEVMQILSPPIVHYNGPLSYKEFGTIRNMPLEVGVWVLARDVHCVTGGRILLDADKLYSHGKPSDNQTPLLTHRVITRSTPELGPGELGEVILDTSELPDNYTWDVEEEAPQSSLVVRMLKTREGILVD